MNPYDLITDNYDPNRPGFSIRISKHRDPHKKWGPHPAGNCYVRASPFTCCGLIELAGFIPNEFESFEDKAQYLQLLFQKFSRPGHLIYVLEKHQLEYPVHKLFVEMGAQQQGETFRNLNYSDHYLSIWLVNAQKFVDSKYLDRYGQINKELKNANSAKPAKPAQ